MRQFTTTELSRMQATQQSAMQDTCQHLARTTTADSFGLPSETFTAALSYACGFEPVSKDEAMEQTEVPMVDARLRLPLSVESVIASVDRLKLTKRFGISLTPQPVFEIIGQPERGPSGLVYNLRRLTT